jgi:hypothetical protein
MGRVKNGSGCWLAKKVSGRERISHARVHRVEYRHRTVAKIENINLIQRKPSSASSVIAFTLACQKKHLSYLFVHFGNFHLTRSLDGEA